MPTPEPTPDEPKKISPTVCAILGVEERPVTKAEVTQAVGGDAWNKLPDDDLFGVIAGVKL
jgi:hypothetical protein